MYSFSDYLHSGIVFLNNRLRPAHKSLTQLMLYSTTRCQSRCRHCSIWKKPDENLSLDDIRKIMSSRCVTPHTTVGLEGGEFVLHPQAEEILAWFRENHPNYTLLSNCLAPDKVIKLVRKYRPNHLYVSLDGDRDTYMRMRGRDGYDKVVQVVEALKDDVPISLMFCLSPWNGFDDMRFVVEFAKRYGIDVRIGIYGTMAFFDTTSEMLDACENNWLGQIPGNIHDTEENYDFVALYDEWKNDRLNLPCKSIFSELVIHSNGDVPVCQNLDLMLGNIHDNTLDKIFNGETARRIQNRQCRECNGCWINFHRKYDIILLRNLERILPKRLIEIVFGRYNWTADRSVTYRKYFARLRKEEDRK